jgi:hypothetical protein
MLEGKPVETIDESDLQNLITNQIMEGKKYDYKKDIIGKPFPTNDTLILRYKQDIRETEKLLAELGLGTPIMDAIKKRLDDG